MVLPRRDRLRQGLQQDVPVAPTRAVRPEKQVEGAAVPAHAEGHSAGGADSISPGSIGAASIGHAHRPLNNWTATAAPTVDDDEGAGYEPGSLWVDQTNNKAYVCLDATSGAASWTEITQAGGGGGAPVDADYLVGTANVTLTNEIVVGPTPGGELGGTWPTPTVDATHSGTPHANVPTQTAALNMGSFQINALATPAISTDAATKGYVDGKKIAHVLVFAAPDGELDGTDTFIPEGGICVGESGEHGTFSGVPRGKAIASPTAGVAGTSTILIEADDSPLFPSATTLHTLALNTANEVDDTTLDNTWNAADIWIRARCSAWASYTTNPEKVFAYFYYYEEVK